ncbi:subtilisin-like protein [Mollisia scopiformis]|uniref:Subtilisin-like protein n=1 Tax=Mollisia scopiformis TaxID=149040 RepID=A0A132B727_MOLSC|nr:subtilisin-like protein [Mollisia scopiformis]KUJ08215.1 subtilisin-like protein [Mollisia scopiformis]
MIFLEQLFFKVFGVLGLFAPIAQAFASFYEARDSTIQDEYIVLLHPDYTLSQHYNFIGVNMSQQSSMFHYLDTINAYGVRASPELVHELIRHDNGVLYIQQNFHLNASLGIDGGSPITTNFPGKGKSRRWTQENWIGRFWNFMLTAGKKLDTIPPEFETEYPLLKYAGLGVVVYVLDTGIRLSHVMLEGRATNFQNFENSPYCNEPMADLVGHGTHVAGIVVNTAPWAYTVNVKVLGEGQSPLGLIRAIVDVTKEHQFYQNNPGSRPVPWSGSVINLSLGFLTTNPIPALQLAVTRAFQAGIPIAASAGNFKNTGQQAVYPPCIYQGSVLCVASCDRNYQKSGFSNFGGNVSIIAPGTNIDSAWFNDDHRVRTVSGTSQATPFLAGVMATFIGYEKISNNPAKVYQRVRQNQLYGIVSGFSADTPNLFLNTGINDPNKDPAVPYHGAPGRDLTSSNDTNTSADGPVTYETVSSALYSYSISSIPSGSVVGYEGEITIGTDSGTATLMPFSSFSVISNSTSLPALPSSTFSTQSTTSLYTQPSSSTQSTVLAPPPPSSTPATTPTATSVSPETNTPYIPPTTPSCVPRPTGSYHDSHETDLTLAVNYFCANNNDAPMQEAIIAGPVTEGKSIVVVARPYTGTTPEDDVYMIKIIPLPYCTPPSGSDINTPVAGSTCSSLLYDAWKNCNNDGRGGSIIASCWTYSVATKW